MENERRYGENLLCAALFVGVVFGIVAGMAIYAVSYPIFQSRNWAAWIQAIGSVIGLFIAIWIANKQTAIAKRAYDQDVMAKNAERERWCEAVVAIIEAAAKQTHALGEATSKSAPFLGDYLNDIRLAYRRPNLVASIDALRSLALPDLRSYDAVQGIMGLANEASLILSYIDQSEELMSAGKPDKRMDGWESLISQASYRASVCYVEAVMGLGGTLKPEFGPHDSGINQGK